MRKHKILPLLLTSFMALSQLGWGTAATADHDRSRSTPSPSASPSASPTPSSSPSPSPTPEASASPSPSPDPTPKGGASPTASPNPSSDSAAGHKKYTDIGPDGCTGVVPSEVFDTVSQSWESADESSFSCDKASGYYLSSKYYLNKQIGWYEIVPPAATPAQLSNMITAPNVVHTVLGDLQVGSKDYQVAQALGLLTSGNGGILSSVDSNGSAPDSSLGSTSSTGSNGITSGTPGQSLFDLTNLVNVINTLQSNATSGNAGVTSNTTAGDSSTGAATVVANLINLLASAWSWSNGNLGFFMQNIVGPQTGDINLNPTQTVTGGGGGVGSTTASINGTGSGSTNGVNVSDPNNISVNAKNTGGIVNNVDVNALSGNSTASKNTVVGNVSTGDANAQVNIINMINSFINSGSSFFGILNILGNLNGDILFPTGFLNGLVPATVGTNSGGTTIATGNTGADSSNQVGVNNSATGSINNSVANAVNNNVLTTAGTGSANVDSNTGAGSVQSGAATTNQSVFNLSNSSIFGDNAVLVMVNVMGHWLGKIMSLPGTGASQSALLTGNATVGVNNTGQNSDNQVNLNKPSSTNVNQNSVGTITNNVNVNAQSGYANATKNTQVGNVTTGNAKADSGIANLFNTVIGVKHWFGVLVINVFGNWLGDVNDHSGASGAGTKPAVTGTANSGWTGANSKVPAVGLIGIVMPVSSNSSVGNGSQSTVTNQIVNNNGNKVLTASAHQLAPVDTAATSKANNLSLMFILSALAMLVAGALLTIDKKLSGK